MSILKSLMNLFRTTRSLPYTAPAITPKAGLNEEITKSLDNWMNRPIYKELTIAIIDATADHELIQTIFDNLEKKFPEDYQKEYETVLSFNKARQTIYVIWLLEAEVNNGGFNQYYENSSGQFAELTPEALRLIGANMFADLMIKANQLYEDENEQITKHMDGTIEGFSKSYEDNPLDAMDTEFYEIEKVENLRELQINFIRKNKGEFADK